MQSAPGPHLARAQRAAVRGGDTSELAKAEGAAIELEALHHQVVVVLLEARVGQAPPAEAIGSNRKQSEAIGSNRKQSEAIGSNRKQSAALEGHGRSWQVMAGHGRSWKKSS